MSDVRIRPITGVVGFDHDLKRGTLGVHRDGCLLGVIVDTGSDWLNGPPPARVCFWVLSAGPGVRVPSGMFDTPEAAAAAIVAARQGAGCDVPADDGLTDFDRRALAFELTAEAVAVDGRRERAIAERFHGIHPALYAARVAALLARHREQAAAVNPAAVAALTARMNRRRARRPKPARGIGG